MADSPLLHPDPTLNKSHRQFFIVGVGASAGGLEALETLFSALPIDSGMAFVVVQHLSPDFKSHMQQLLGRRTEMPVHRVENSMRVEPNAIYLIPPKMEMVISDGKLLLTEKSTDGTLSHPIDQFFRSLATDAGPFGIGVVLSGTGSDGTRGIVDIHSAGGLVLAQDTESAKFDGMPFSAVSTGVVDITATPEQIAKALVRYSRGGQTATEVSDDLFGSAPLEGIERIFQLLHQQHGIDFSHYKASTVGRRIQRRIEMAQLDSIDLYLAKLEDDPTEINDLYKDLLIGVTKFFRDPEAFASLESQVISRLFHQRNSLDSIRVWVAGCASGEEAYSMAILIDEEMRRRRQQIEIKVFATDAHHVSLHTAATGIYPPEALSEMSAERRGRYFHKKQDGYQVTPELRRCVIFAPHNVITDAPFTQIDIVTCRNLLIYLQPLAQKKALSLFHFALKSGGTLMLGPSETPGELSDEFNTLDKRWRIYTKRRDVRLPLETPVRIGVPLEKKLLTGPKVGPEGSKVQSSLLETYDRLLNQKMPPSILVNESNEILHVFGGAQKFLQYTVGRPTNNLLDAIIEPLKTPLTGAIQHAIRKQDTVRYTGLQAPSNGGMQNLQISVELIQAPKSGSHNCLVEILSVDDEDLRSSGAPQADLTQISQERIETLEGELRYAQENLQATVEEMETANEELQATNEELTASNEELQSTNEELHSVNEELYTVNAEHQRRVEELTEANNDMDNLLATTRVGVIFLDQEFCIRRFTPEITRLFHLVPQDIGRSIHGFAHNLEYDNLLEDLKAVFDEQKEKEVNIYDHSGTPFLLRMMPYRSGNAVEGVVMTLVDIQSLVEAQQEMERFKYMADSASDMFVLTDEKGKLVYFNPTFVTESGYSEADLAMMSIQDVDPAIDEARVRQLLDEPDPKNSDPLETQIRRKDGSRFLVEMNVSVVTFGQQNYLFATMRDITARRDAELQSRLQFQAIESAVNGIIICDMTKEDQPITYANPGFYEMTGYSPEEVIGRNCRFLQGEKTSPENIAMLRELIAKGEQCLVTILNYRKDGTEFWNELQLTPVRNPDGELTNYVGVQHDVTVQREAHRELENANAELAKNQRALVESKQRAQDASRAKSEFLANVSHELRTPMTAVLGFAEMLRMELKNPEDQEKVDTITRNGQYLLSLLNDILDLSKIEAGKMEVEQANIEPGEVIKDVANLMSVRAKQQGIPLHFEYMTEVPRTITADRVRLRQILVNLIGNALKFTEEGEVRVSLSVEQDRQPAEFVFEVRDTGIGIAPEQHQDLFKPFSQGSHRTERKYGGTGLGLSISQRLASAMGGRIDVQSESGNGSTFRFRLPLTDEQLHNLHNDDHPVGQPIEPSNSSFEFPKLDHRILLADDRPDIWRVVQYFMQKCGSDVVVVENGQDAVDEATRANHQGQPFDLVLMDMHMPVMTGKEAVIELRKRGFDVPIIALTADAMDGEREACIAFGCNDYLAKPIDGRKLVQLVAETLRLIQRK